MTTRSETVFEDVDGDQLIVSIATERVSWDDSPHKQPLEMAVIDISTVVDDEEGQGVYLTPTKALELALTLIELAYQANADNPER
jgi:hypothetical protein